MRHLTLILFLVAVAATAGFGYEMGEIHRLQDTRPLLVLECDRVAKNAGSHSEVRSQAFSFYNSSKELPIDVQAEVVYQPIHEAPGLMLYAISRYGECRIQAEKVK